VKAASSPETPGKEIFDAMHKRMIDLGNVLCLRYNSKNKAGELHLITDKQ
jgi:hypothetical protein